MLFSTIYCGGTLLIMMGHNTRSESLFYYFRIEDHVPEDHLLRLVDRHIDFTFVRETLKASYSHTGRPSIDPEVLLRILLIGYLYGITSERRLVEDVGMHLAYRWFTGLGFDQEVPHHSTFSKNRHGRFQESPLFLELFERIVQQCMSVGLLKGVDLSVDSTQIRADASPDRAITREQLPEVAKVNRTVREYVEQVERENIIAEQEQTSDASASEAEDKPEVRRTYRNSPPMKISTTDPEAALSSKRGASEFAYHDNYLIDNRSCIIAGVMATPARLSQEIIAARHMLERAKERFGLQPASVTADKSYDTGEFLSWLSNRQMTPYIPVLDRKQQTKGFYTQNDFIRLPEENAYRSRGAQGFTYSAKPSHCRNCSHKPACTPSSTHRTLRVNWYEGVREDVRKLSQTPEFAIARRARNKIEALFSELRNQVRLRKLRLRGLPKSRGAVPPGGNGSKPQTTGPVHKPKQRTGISDGLKRPSLKSQGRLTRNTLVSFPFGRRVFQQQRSFEHVSHNSVARSRNLYTCAVRVE
ncbi:MAG: IS1182 family transposase [Nitrospirota bacterium]|nr:IS1182 family transposase [Nitrospirota bacterium]